MRFIFLNQEFYDNHTETDYKQIERKVNRPYIHYILSYNNIAFAIPLRSHITHPYAYFTDKKNRCGVDFSKAVPIVDTDIDNERIPHIRTAEYKRLPYRTRIFKVYTNI